VTDDELDQAIAHAVNQPAGRGLDELVALRDRVQSERQPLDPGLARTWDALVQVARRSPTDIADFFGHAEGRARWLAAVRGPTHRETIHAWADLGEAADLECDWEIATRAWEAVAGAPLDGADRPTQAAISQALRGLGARRLATGQLADARVLFERDLVLSERLYPSPHPQLALSLGNLAYALEQIGDHTPALQLRQRQRDTLVASGAASGLVAAVDEKIARLSGS
jgi:hypothetical protein